MKYIVPPKLNQKFTFFGLTIFEAITIIATFILGVFLKTVFLIILSSAIAVLSIRTVDNKNMIYLFKRKIKYHTTTQIFNARSIRKNEENSTDN